MVRSSMIRDNSESRKAEPVSALPFWRNSTFRKNIEKYLFPDFPADA